MEREFGTNLVLLVVAPWVTRRTLLLEGGLHVRPPRVDNDHRHAAGQPAFGVGDDGVSRVGDGGVCDVGGAASSHLRLKVERQVADLTPPLSVRFSSSPGSGGKLPAGLEVRAVGGGGVVEVRGTWALGTLLTGAPRRDESFLAG